MTSKPMPKPQYIRVAKVMVCRDWNYRECPPGFYTEQEEKDIFRQKLILWPCGKVIRVPKKRYSGITSGDLTTLDARIKEAGKLIDGLLTAINTSEDHWDAEEYRVLEQSRAWLKKNGFEDNETN